MIARLLRACSVPSVLGSVALLVTTAVGAVPLTSVPNPRVRDGTWVTDMPGALRADTIARLNSTIDALERTIGAEMAVVVVDSLDGLSIEEAAARLFAQWGIGKKGRDNGVLLLWSTGDRRVRVEVGYGLEGVLPDGKVGAILDTYVIPRFRAGEFDEGLLAGVDALVRGVRDEPVELPAPGSGFYERGLPNVRSWVVGLLTAVPASLASLLGFRRWRRYRRRRCPQCQAVMARLGETEDDSLLENAQQVEERIGSVDYDVWTCPSCAHHFTLRYARWFSRYGKCPQCHNRTKSSKETTLVAATTSSSGSARVEERCAFCSFRREYTKVLPRIERSSSSGSSGGSFGGGRSGGGGASRGY